MILIKRDKENIFELIRKDHTLNYRILTKRIVVFILSCIMFQSIIVAKETTKNIWTIPDCVGKRPMGSYPPGATGRTKRGIPLGGVGAGNFMYNLCGSFGIPIHTWYG
jgi:hypothetical protein